MNDSILVVMLSVIAVVAFALAVWQIVGRLKARHEAVIAAVQLTQLQLKEVRDGVDRLEVAVAGIEERLRDEIDPALQRLSRLRRIDQVERTVQEAASRGTVGDDSQRALKRHLARLAADDARGG